jgi:hypothetical protein
MPALLETPQEDPHVLALRALRVADRTSQCSKHSWRRRRCVTLHEWMQEQLPFLVP